jgi:hypothetical protein
MKMKFRKLVSLAKWAAPLMAFVYWSAVYAESLAKLIHQLF